MLRSAEQKANRNRAGSAVLDDEAVVAVAALVCFMCLHTLCPLRGPLGTWVSGSLYLGHCAVAHLQAGLWTPLESVAEHSRKHTTDREHHSTTSRLDLPLTNGGPDPQMCRGAPPSLLKQTKTASWGFFLAIVSQMTENTIFQNGRRVLKALVKIGEVHFT